MGCMAKGYRTVGQCQPIVLAQRILGLKLHKHISFPKRAL